MRKKVICEIMNAICAQRLTGELRPVGAAWRSYAGFATLDEFYCTARLAGYNVKKRGGVWYERDMEEDERMEYTIID